PPGPARQGGAAEAGRPSRTAGSPAVSSHRTTPVARTAPRGHNHPPNLAPLRNRTTRAEAEAVSRLSPAVAPRAMGCPLRRVGPEGVGEEFSRVPGANGRQLLALVTRRSRLRSVCRSPGALRPSCDPCLARGPPQSAGNEKAYR